MSGKSRWVWSSLLLQSALLAYYEAIEWINIFPWNDIRKGNGQARLDWIVTAVVIVLNGITLIRLKWGMIAAVLGYGFWLWLQIDGWWLPYIRGASPGWARVYSRFFSQTVKFLPSFGTHLAPDACHIVLQGLVAGAMVTTLLGIVEIRRTKALP